MFPKFEVQGTKYMILGDFSENWVQSTPKINICFQILDYKIKKGFSQSSVILFAEKRVVPVFKSCFYLESW